MLSGGGSNGSWEAGVLWGLTHFGDPNDFAYDWISGISAGAINTACLSGWAKGDEKAATEYLSYTWTTLTNKDIWAYWDVGPVRSLWESPSLLDDEPAVEFIAAQSPGHKPHLDSVFGVGATTAREESAQANAKTGQHCVHLCLLNQTTRH